MNAEVRHALETDRTIDITTRGRKSGQSRLTEIWFHNVDGRFYITGLPGPRSWYANMLAEPKFTFHLKESTRADLPATARAITDADERRQALSRILANLGRDNLDEWLDKSPLIEVQFDSM